MKGTEKVKSLLIAAAIAAALPLAGCQSHMHVLENAGHMRVEPSTLPDSDYVVHLRNFRDINYDPDDKANRESWALAMTKTQCPAGRIVKTDSFTSGSRGRAARTYYVYVRCNG